MSFIWFAIKVYVFDALYTNAIGFILLPVVLVAVPKQPATQTASVPVADSNRKMWVVSAVVFLVVFALCAVQGLIVAAAVKLSLLARPDAWWLFWYLVGFSASIPVGLIADHRENTMAQLAQLCCFVGATGTYVVACIWPTVVPTLLMRVAQFLSV